MSQGDGPTQTAARLLGQLDHYFREHPVTGPTEGRTPTRAQDVYAWCVANTDHAGETTRLRRDTVIYRQYLEHALRTGDKTVIRRHRCPECRTWGLMWQAGRQLALCTNGDCVDTDGCSTTVTLARLAHEHIAGKKNLRKVSTT